MAYPLVSFDNPAPCKLPNGTGALYTTSTGDVLFLCAELSESLDALKLQPGEQVGICLYSDRGGTRWNVWLMPETEKARARAEAAKLDLEAQLRASLKVVQGRKKGGVLPGEGETNSVPFLAPTGTEGGAVPLPLPASRKFRREGPIPLNVAFREIVRFVVKELNDSGEQWSDSSRQDLVSTVMIAAQKSGLLGVWEREAA